MLSTIAADSGDRWLKGLSSMYTSELEQNTFAKLILCNWLDVNPAYAFISRESPSAALISSFKPSLL